MGFSGHMWLFRASQLWEAGDVLNCLNTDSFEYILRCAGMGGNSFQTKQGNWPSCRDQEGRKLSDEVVPGTSVFPLVRTVCRGTFGVTSRVKSSISHFKSTWSSVVAAPRLWRMGSVDVVHRLSCPATHGPSWTRNQTVCPALAGRFFTTEPPRKPVSFLLLSVETYLNILESSPLLYFCDL